MNDKTGRNLNVVKKLTIKSAATGATETSGKLQKLQDAYERNTKAFELVIASQLSLADAVDRVERAFAAASARPKRSHK